MIANIADFLASRRTTNLFDPDQRLDDAQLRDLVRIASTAPSAFNLQNWRFIAVRSEEAKQRLRAVAWDQAKITDAAATFIMVGELADHRTLPARLQGAVDAGFMPAEMVPGWEGAARSLYADQPQRQRDEAVRSATFAATTLIHAARTLGLGAAPMIGFDADAVAREFGLGTQDVPVMLLAIGVALPENWPQKPRRPVAELLQFA
ncbi:nitroreductase family protein [Stenotrophomonas sp. 24(2023)]|uniref:nitroreductase family protein n=1 Tax=Stenotrophomonas sp. 24(2023) TaxID=3068324 RepID=UPI0027E19E6B|nr:nitroreductase family protein [Stenotrophomonas sp. 24(2023)]WMJ69645.1 nitroreductase family protein [Stenotrophomonas sp. 24(2023)]